MKYNGQLSIATGLSFRTKKWKNETWNWSAIVDKLRRENKTNETFKEFVGASKEEQGKIKDVGGYVGGYLKSGKRNPQNVEHRQIITLDIDFAHIDLWSDFTLEFGNAAVLHATHKHSEAAPRYRLVMPLSREVTPDEYVAISRMIAGIIGIDLFDNTTFETNRLMFWPSNPSDVQYYCEVQDGEFLDADWVLGMYEDWTDTTQWPTANKHLDDVKRVLGKQQDPHEKRGIIGAFCRTYSMTDVLDTVLADEYIPTSDPNRYSYAGGSTAGGLIVYDDLFAFSHHGTDPCSGKLCNVFDIVRIHKFDDKDPKKSFKMMEAFALKDDAVKKNIALDKIQNASYDFEDDIEDVGFEDVDDVEWMVGLEVDARGNYAKTAANIDLIFDNDVRLKNAFARNSFSKKDFVLRSLPWEKITGPRPIKNSDFALIRNYFDCIYGIDARGKIEDSWEKQNIKNEYNPILRYLDRLQWDGKPRIDTLLIDYFGATDNLYTREAIRKMLVGAITRIKKPGCKFDLALVLIGDQGTYKSSFISKLGGEWYSDTFSKVDGKGAYEQLHGVWIMEMAELSGLKKAEVESIKHFLSKQEDMFRPAYGRVVETFGRTCVFFGTTNTNDFLTDATGNRRFMPIDVVPSRVTKKVFGDLTQKEIDQIWAEAVQLYSGGETLVLSDEANRLATLEQKGHSVEDDRLGHVEEYLNRKITEDWDQKNIQERKLHYEDDLSQNGTVDREFVTIPEIWVECFGKNRGDIDSYRSRQIHNIMKGLPEWERVKKLKTFKLYGRQRYYRRKESDLM